VEEGLIKENGGEDEFKYVIFDTHKNFCKCHSVPPPSTTIKTYFFCTNILK
jgi:hypothetical protein